MGRCPSGHSNETPATLHWSQTTSYFSSTTATITTTTYNCTTTKVHYQPSIHVNGRCYNINMPETQHLDHLSTALHILLPTMKTFHTKHRAYKFQVAIMIVCNKVVDPSVVTQPPVTLTSKMIAVYTADVPPRRHQPTATKLYRDIRIERIGVGILQLSKPYIIAARPFTK